MTSGQRMIVKVIPAHKAGSGKALASYVLDLKLARDEHGRALPEYASDLRHGSEKVEWARTVNTGVNDVRWAIQAIELHNAQNTHAHRLSRYEHIVVSFVAGERPSREQMAVIEDRLMAAIGWGDHPRVSAVHKPDGAEVANWHLHIAVSRISPTTLKAEHPRYNHFHLQAEAGRLEIELGLTQEPKTVLSRERAELDLMQAAHQALAESAAAQQMNALRRALDRADESASTPSPEQPRDQLALDLLRAIEYALGSTDPQEQVDRLIDAAEEAIYLNEGAGTPSVLAQRLTKIIALASADPAPEATLIRGTREALRRNEAHLDPRYNQPLPQPAPEPPRQPSDVELERLHKDALADQVPSDHRRLTVEDIAAELSPEYRQAREELKKLTWERRTARSAMLHAEAQQGAGEHRVAERREEIGRVRSVLHNLRMPGQRWNEVRWWQDRQLHNWERLQKSGEFGAARHGTKVKLADDRTEMWRERMKAAFDAVSGEAATELDRRRQLALSARVTLAELRNADAEYVEGQRIKDEPDQRQNVAQPERPKQTRRLRQ